MTDRKTEALLAGLMLISFFRPWIYSMGAPVAAYEIRARLESPKHLLSVFSAGERVATDYRLALGLYLLPLLAGGILLAILMGRYRSWAGFAAGLASTAAFIFLRSEVGSFAFHRLASGSYVALCAGLGLAAMALWRGVSRG